MDGSNEIAVDAVPQNLPVTFVENECHRFKIEDVLSEFSSEDYKSAFFLLIDFISIEGFFKLTNKSLPYLKKTFIELYHKRLDESLLVELLGVLKMHRKLRILGTCSHVYESKEKYNDRIHGFWKMLYALCEELTDDELNTLKLNVESNYKDEILSMEDWFCWAFKNGMFTKTDVSYLKEIFRKFPKCLNILNSYKGFALYNVRKSTAGSDCGIALIFNYEKFNKNTGLLNRKYSHKDVDSLKHLWDTFGFRVEIHPNLTYEETFQKMEHYASLNYSQYDVFVCCILSHGESGVIYSSDGELMEITDLITPIVNCVTLKKKPKLFFIQACQGQNIPEGVGKPIVRLQCANVKPAKKRYSSPPLLVDTLKVNSSIDGYVSFIDNEGSWFIQSLCKLMMQEGENSSVEEVMTMVHEEVKNNYAARLGQLCPKGTIQIVGQNEYFDNFEQNNDRKGIQLVGRESTLGKKLFLKKRVKSPSWSFV